MTEPYIRPFSDRLVKLQVCLKMGVNYFIWRFPSVFNNRLLFIVKGTIKLMDDAKTLVFSIQIT
jgi:hypothetical protein